jgi:predicted aspartyl protease
MTGNVDSEGTPVLRLNLAGHDWLAIIDTGFNGDLELPDVLAAHFGGIPSGQERSMLADGTIVIDDLFLIDFPFDNRVVKARVSYARARYVLIGTGLMADHRLEIDFPAKTVDIVRVQGP